MGKNKEKKKRKRKKSRHLKVKIHNDLKQKGGSRSNDTQLLNVAQIGADQRAIALFTKQNQKCEVHYYSDPEINAYVLCNNKSEDDTCILCDIGRDLRKRLLLPVFSPETNKVQVLSVSESMRSYALLPQIANVDVDEPKVIFVSRSGYDYKLSVGVIDDETLEVMLPIVEKFMSNWEKGEIDLRSVYQRLPNAVLKMNPEIEKMMRLKGIWDEEDED